MIPDKKALCTILTPHCHYHQSSFLLVHQRTPQLATSVHNHPVRSSVWLIINISTLFSTFLVYSWNCIFEISDVWEFITRWKQFHSVFFFYFCCQCILNSDTSSIPVHQIGPVPDLWKPCNLIQHGPADWPAAKHRPKPSVRLLARTGTRTAPLSPGTLESNGELCRGSASTVFVQEFGASPTFRHSDHVALSLGQCKLLSLSRGTLIQIHTRHPPPSPGLPSFFLQTN